jgi:4-hydroxy-2-oxoheptanedioate aldolase
LGAARPGAQGGGLRYSAVSAWGVKRNIGLTARRTREQCRPRKKAQNGRNALRENKLRTLWKNGGVAVNGWLGIPSSASAESMARCGWDSVVVDLQHGLVDYTDAVPMLQAISQTDATPMARAPWNMPDIIMKLLDAGAYGIVCPMINTPAECEEFIQNCRYAPRGRRSFGPIRAAMYGGADYWKYANETILTIAMIETQQAMDNLDAILKTDSLDAIYVGPSDLGLSLGHQPMADPTAPKVMDAIKFIIDTAKKHKIPAGIHCGAPAWARDMIGLGYQLVTLGNDNSLMQSAARNAIAATREGAPKPAEKAGLY